MNENVDSKVTASALLEEMCSVIDYVGSSFGHKTSDELGIITTTFRELANRTVRNLGSIYVLIEDHDYLKHNRQPIMVLLRTTIGDLLVGAYLHKFKDDVISFQNELNVLNRDFANFADFIISEEPNYSFAAKEFSGLSVFQISELVQQKKKSFQERNSSLYIDGELKRTADLRATSNDTFFEDTKDGQIQIIKNSPVKEGYIFSRFKYWFTQNNQDPKPITHAYLLYRAYSQYSHFSMLASPILNKEEEAEIEWIIKGIAQCYVLLDFLLDALQIDQERKKAFINVFQKHY